VEFNKQWANMEQHAFLLNELRIINTKKQKK
jgi:hypothetical protein